MDNQTEELWLQNVSPTDLGTGVFAFTPTPTQRFDPWDWSEFIEAAGYRSLTKALRADITYPTCVREGMAEGMVAFKWVPETLADFDTVKSAAVACKPVLCVKRCANYGCVCIAGECK